MRYSALAFALLAGVVNAQSFQPGEVYHVTASLPGGATNSYGIALVGSGGAGWTGFADSDVSFRAQGAAFCPSRASIAVTNNTAVYLFDAAGDRSTIGPLPRQVNSLAARGDGTLYAAAIFGAPAPVEVIRPDDSFGSLDDGAGSPFVLPLANCQCLWYDAGTNALFTAHWGSQTTIVKVPLAPDGQSVSGPVTQTTFNGSSGFEVPIQFSQGPGGTLMIKVDDNEGGLSPRMFTVDPLTLATAAFASNNYFGVAAEIGGVYLPEFNAVLGVDTLGDRYRRHAQGSAGAGVDAGPAASTGGGSGEQLTLLRIPESDICVADVNTTNTNPGDAGYGEADGVVDGADLSYFVENWLGGTAAVADVNTTNTNPGDASYGAPDGEVDGADLSFFVENWLAGCP